MKQAFIQTKRLVCLNNLNIEQHVSTVYVTAIKRTGRKQARCCNLAHNSEAKNHIELKGNVIFYEEKLVI